MKISCVNSENPSGIPVEAKLMQYTGLKDKNGKEIYEGDIVNKENRCSHHRTSESRFTNFAVVWNEKKFSFGLLCEKNKLIYELKKYNMEVIGNIYENPGLLENNK